MSREEVSFLKFPSPLLFLIVAFLSQKSDWQQRRHQKAEKKELLALQSELKSEIDGKNQALQEVREFKLETEKQVTYQKKLPISYYLMS